MEKISDNNTDKYSNRKPLHATSNLPAIIMLALYFTDCEMFTVDMVLGFDLDLQNMRKSDVNMSTKRS